MAPVQATTGGLRPDPLKQLSDYATSRPLPLECTPMYDANDGILTAVAKCGVDGICQ